MNIYGSKRWMEDLDAAVGGMPELEALAGRAVMITGAAGLICSAMTDILLRYNETHTAPIQILAAGRWLEEMTGRFGARCDRDYFHFVRYDAARSDNALDVPCDYIIHGASNAFPSMILKEPVETMLSNFTGLYNLLNCAREQGTKRVLYISSSEVYGQRATGEPYREGDYGYIDLLNPRNSYSMGKRAAETLCASCAAEYGVENVIVRPGHIYGPTASPQDTRVSSAWAYAAARGEDIVMKSSGAQLRSYCYCMDCATAILTVLLKGADGEAYNISNPDSICTIAELAREFADVGGVRIVHDVPSEAERKGFNLMENSSLNAEKLLGLGWRGRYSLKHGARRTVEILREEMR